MNGSLHVYWGLYFLQETGFEFLECRYSVQAKRFIHKLFICLFFWMFYECRSRVGMFIRSIHYQILTEMTNQVDLLINSGSKSDIIMIRLARAARFWASKLTPQEVIDRSYDQLSTLLAQKYGQREYRNSNAACLHQIQHHFQVLRHGDCVLDIGAGPDFYWTDLALNMTQAASHMVISNDLKPTSRSIHNNKFVLGDFKQEPVQTNIALALGQRKLDAILLDASPPYTGNLQKDGMEITNLVKQTLTFGSTFLQKGGNFVCKVLDCSSTKLIEEAGQIYFGQMAAFRPSVLRPQCPVKFLVMKGFGMNHNFSALKQFIGQYRGSAKNKIAVVQKYKGKYSWNPVDILNKRAKEDILGLREKGRSHLDIERMFANDPFVKIGSIMKQLRELEKARETNDSAHVEKAINKFTDGQLYPEAKEVPTSRQEWIDFLDELQKDYREHRKKKKTKTVEKKRNLAPLEDDEVYMKQQTQVEQAEIQRLYLEADLQGNFSPIYQEEHVEQEIQKLSRMNPKAASWFRQKKKKGQNITLEEVFKQAQTTQEQVNRNLRETSEALRAMTDEQYKQILDKEGYKEQIEQTMLKADPKARLKFRNK